MFRKLSILVFQFALLAALPLAAERQAVQLVGGVWVDIGTLGGDAYSRALGVNGSHVVGSSAPLVCDLNGNCIATPQHAFSYSGSMSALGWNGEAAAVNASSQIAGRSSTPAFHAVFFDGSVHDLDANGFSVGYGINDAGTAVGESVFTTGGPVHASKWVSGVATDLGVLSGGIESVAHAINTAGVIVGVSQTASDGWHLFKYSGTTMTDIGKPPGSCYLDTDIAINDSNVIAGWACGGAYYWDGSYHTLPLLGSDTANYATSISASGVVVGWGSPSRHPCSYDIGTETLTDLGLTTASGNWEWVNATAISGTSVVGFAGMAADIFPPCQDTSRHRTINGICVP